MARLWPGGWWGRAAPISKQQGRRRFSSTHTGTGGWCYTDPDDKDSVTQCKDEDDYDLCKTFHPGVKAVVTVSRIHMQPPGPANRPPPPPHPSTHTHTHAHLPTHPTLNLLAHSAHAERVPTVLHRPTLYIPLLTPQPLTTP